jgi:hypothetical protein
LLVSKCQIFSEGGVYEFCEKHPELNFATTSDGAKNPSKSEAYVLDPDGYRVQLKKRFWGP